MAFLHYILFMYAAKWFFIVCWILIAIALVAGIICAVQEKNWLILTAPIVVWAVLLFFYFCYDKLHLIIIPF